jgi:hypothetical protein
MINEVYELNQSQVKSGINRDRESWHKNYGTCPKRLTFYLYIAKDGSITNIEIIDNIEKITSLRKWEVANGVSFPSFNIPPLFHAKSEDALNELRILKKSIKEGNLMNIESIIDKCEKSGIRENGKGKITQCLNSAGLDVIIKDIPDDFKSLEELIKRSKKLCEKGISQLQDRLVEIIIKHINEDPKGTAKWVDPLLLCSAKKPETKKVSLVLELDDRSQFQYPANHEKVRIWINSQLMKTENIQNTETSSVIDAFGKPNPDEREKFPDINLPILGNVKLRSMSSESPCQQRYGKADSGSFPMSKILLQELKDSLEWLGKNERRGKTWQNVSDSCGYDKGLLFVYPSSLPSNPPEIAGLFVREENDDDPEGCKYEAAAARITPAIQGIVKEHPDAMIKIFVLSKPDGFRTKVLVSRQYGSPQLIDSATKWQEGCRNIPSIHDYDQRIPYPDEVVKCLNLAWLKGGENQKSVFGLGIGEGISLMVESGTIAKRITERALHLAVTNVRPLLFALGHASHRQDNSFKIPGQYIKHPSLIPGIIGLLLSKLGYKKGDYMHTAPFYVGQMLSLADILHREYCRLKRKDVKLPAQLIGNALMSAAIDNPEKGLARLRERLMIYQAWARTSEGEEFKTAFWTLREFGRISKLLSEQTLPTRTNDADKAQMLLGYLAHIED